VWIALFVVTEKADQVGGEFIWTLLFHVASWWGLSFILYTWGRIQSDSISVTPYTPGRTHYKKVKDCIRVLTCRRPMSEREKREREERGKRASSLSCGRCFKGVLVLWRRHVGLGGNLFEIKMLLSECLEMIIQLINFFSIVGQFQTKRLVWLVTGISANLLVTPPLQFFLYIRYVGIADDKRFVRTATGVLRYHMVLLIVDCFLDMYMILANFNFHGSNVHMNPAFVAALLWPIAMQYRNLRFVSRFNLIYFSLSRLALFGLIVLLHSLFFKHAYSHCIYMMYNTTTTGC
jgi:hypothetical protein